MHDLFDPTDTWVAIDFETATSDRYSACSVGIAVVQHGGIVDRSTWLIQPPGNLYDSRNTRVHGLAAADTACAPRYADVFASISPFLQGRRVLAHSAAFDISVLRAVHDYYDVALPELEYACSCAMTRRAFPSLPNHRLPTVCDHCGIELDHHDAGSDSTACALVALNCRDAVGVATIQEAVESLGVAIRRA